jgi:glycosyltransferase involved in cell wall biosynthesis
MRPDLTVVIPSLNGAAGVDRCLRALAVQTIRSRMEVVVVDDGSTDDTAAVADRHGVTVIRHAQNRGVAAARNSGLAAASADIVAYLDDDCEPQPDWAATLLAGYDIPEVAGVGGLVVPCTPPGYLSGFLRRNNPLSPLEIELGASGRLPYRFYLYLRRQWSMQPRTGQRDVYSIVGANMSFRRKTLFDVGQFDERFHFGAEELDLCMRVIRDIPGARISFLPECSVTHHFERRLRDTLRRSRAYGIGSARLYRKWPGLVPTIFPGPIAVVLALAASPWLPWLAVAALVAPVVMYPKGFWAAVGDRRPAALLDSYVQLLQEASENVGFAEGFWRFRRFTPERSERVDCT